MPSTVSTIPAVLNRLVELARAALPDVQVWDGPPVRDVEDDYVEIGSTGDPDEEAVEDSRTRRGLAPDPDMESYEIANQASCWLGSMEDLKPTRDRCFGFINAINAELVRDQALGVPGVLRARLSVVGYVPGQTLERGAVTTIRFVITVQAQTR